MSVTLYTPGTGFPDLEAKIAYGLARVGIESGCEPSIIPQNGFYQLEFENYSTEKMNKTFLLIASRILSSNKFFNLGIKARYRDLYPTKDTSIERIKNYFYSNSIDDFYKLIQNSNYNIKRKKVCGHENISKFGSSRSEINTSESGGLVLLASSHAGKPCSRDIASDNFNLSLCELCGYFSVLGIFSFSFVINIGSGKNRKNVIFIPIPNKKVTFEDLQMLLSLQKTLHNYWLSDLQPMKTFTLGLLAKVPSLSDIINKLLLNFHLSYTSKDTRGDTIIEHTAYINAVPFSRFVSNSPYNSATVTSILGVSRSQLSISSLFELTNILEYKKKSELIKFSRIFNQETSSKDYINFLYPETSKYLLREIAMIKTEIIENKAISRLASTLRYFIRERKYSYADNIRNARKESKDFEETIVKMLREGELRRIQQEQHKASGKEIKNWIKLPNENEVKEVFRLANDDFESTKNTLVILAFSFPPKGERESIEDENIKEDKND